MSNDTITEEYVLEIKPFDPEESIERLRTHGESGRGLSAESRKLPVEINGVSYESVSAAARAQGVTPSAMSEWIRRRGRKVAVKGATKRKPKPQQDGIACAYKMTVGRHFYIGSTRDIMKRRLQHFVNLEKGTHPNGALQEAFDRNITPEYRAALAMKPGHARTAEVSKHRIAVAEFVVLRRVERVPGESNKDLSDRLREAEQAHLTKWFGHQWCCNKSPDARGPNNGGVLKAMWEKEDFREIMRRTRENYVPSDVARMRMAKAKKGSRNYASRAVWVKLPKDFGRFGGDAGVVRNFACFRDAAAYLHVSSQAVANWVNGVTPWPTAERRKGRGHSQRLAGLVGGFGIREDGV